MSAVSESASQRMTLEWLAEHYGFELIPDFAGDVTVTSIADDKDSVRPGCLYMPSKTIDVERLRQARDQGAYAAVVPRSMRDCEIAGDFPLLCGEPSARQLGLIASDMAGDPSESLAVFVVAGRNGEAVAEDVRTLADFLHMLGNPVGVISASYSQSLDRFLDLKYPLGILDMQRTLSVCVEDGASAIIIAMDEATLRHDALQAVNVDVLGIDGARGASVDDSIINRLCLPYGYASGKQTHVTARTTESDSLAAQAAVSYEQGSLNSLSLAIAMVLAAGVRKNNIKSALRVSRDLL